MLESQLAAGEYTRVVTPAKASREVRIRRVPGRQRRRPASRRMGRMLSAVIVIVPDPGPFVTHKFVKKLVRVASPQNQHLRHPHQRFVNDGLCRVYLLAPTPTSGHHQRTAGGQDHESDPSRGQEHQAVATR